jgi:hypothetical protein
MPVPEGQITTSQIWNGEPEKEKPEKSVQNSEENVQKENKEEQK